MNARLGGTLLAIAGVLLTLAGAALFVFLFLVSLTNPGRRGIEKRFDVPVQGTGRVTLPVKAGWQVELTLYATLDGAYGDQEEALRLPAEIRVVGADRALRATYRGVLSHGMYEEGNPNVVLGLGQSSLGTYNASVTEKVTVETGLGPLAPSHARVTHASLVVFQPGYTFFGVARWAGVIGGVSLIVIGIVLRRRAT
jgi:hypothetical protein